MTTALAWRQPLHGLPQLGIELGADALHERSPVELGRPFGACPLPTNVGDRYALEVRTPLVASATPQASTPRPPGSRGKGPKH